MRIVLPVFPLIALALSTSIALAQIAEPSGHAELGAGGAMTGPASATKGPANATPAPPTPETTAPAAKPNPADDPTGILALKPLPPFSGPSGARQEAVAGMRAPSPPGANKPISKHIITMGGVQCVEFHGTIWCPPPQTVAAPK